ncbi:MAG TPA: hypothetical protein DCZ91_05785 [Lachnospiraceae bacterium]|nr:hypothetical protein [Lachnospiraceae bacterium]
MAENLNKMPLFSSLLIYGEKRKKRNIFGKVSVKSFGNNFEIRCKLHNYVHKSPYLAQKLHKIRVDAILKI